MEASAYRFFFQGRVESNAAKMEKVAFDGICAGIKPTKIK